VSVGESVRRGVYVLLACCIVLDPAAAQDLKSATSSQAAKADVQPTLATLSFVRSFSSADDLRRPTPVVVDRTLDIIAGPKEPELHVDVLQSPSAVTTDSNERVFVSDPGAKAVHMFDFYRSEYRLLRDGKRLASPGSVAVDSQDDLYVIDESSRTALVYNSAGKFLRYLGRLRGGESYFDSPAGIAIDKTTGRVYICDMRRNMVIVMDDRGRVIAKFGKRGGGDGPGEFRLPSQVAVGGGQLFVLDAGNMRIQILDTAGRFQRDITLAFVNRRTGLAIDHQGNIYVSDPALNQVEVFSREGLRLYTFDPSTIKGANFGHPSGMWIHAGSCLYVVDSQSQRVGLLQISGGDAGRCR
jgi:DNA-binding beta-propeller fold protein YncE